MDSIRCGHEARADFLGWAARAAVPIQDWRCGTVSHALASLDSWFSEARLLGFGEAVHGAAEPLEFRNCLFRYLVEVHGFTAIAIETGLVEGRSVQHYVDGSDDDLDAALERGISWTMDQLPQNRTLVEWIRDFNRATTGKKIRFYGFDVAGSPGEPRARRGLETALAETLAWVKGVDPESCDRFESRFSPFMSVLSSKDEAHDYWQLTGEEKDRLTAAIADLNSLIRCKEADHVACSSQAEYEWGRRIAICARQVDEWLRLAPRITCEALTDNLPGVIQDLIAASNARDRAQADNLSWIAEREGQQGKVFVFAARSHLCATPRHWAWQGREHRIHSAGSYLRRRFGEGYRVIANLVGEGRASCGLDHQVLEPAPDATMDGLGGALDVPAYLLDLGKAPPPAQAFLCCPQELAHQGFGHSAIIPSDAFDTFLYCAKVSPSVPAFGGPCPR
jgi:erythromycin esterase